MITANTTLKASAEHGAVITVRAVFSKASVWSADSREQRRSEGRRLTVGVESSTLADGVPVLDVLPPASSKGVRPVLPNKERKES